MRLITFLFLLGISPSLAGACSCRSGSGCWSPSSPIKIHQFVGKPTAVHPAPDGAVAIDFTVSEAFGTLSGKTYLTI
jgi:hypothetical protein